MDYLFHLMLQDCGKMINEDGSISYDDNEVKEFADEADGQLE